MIRILSMMLGFVMATIVVSGGACLMRLVLHRWPEPGELALCLVFVGLCESATKAIMGGE